MSRAVLILEDKAILKGRSFGAETDASGEVVFNTGMVGYPETLTDPSYKGQILVLTYPLVGNYGIAFSAKCKVQSAKLQFKVKSYQTKKQFNNRTIEQFHNFESDKIQIAGLVVSEYCSQYSHPQAMQSLGEWLKSENIPAIEGIDTRALTEKLREKGTMLGIMSNVKCQMAFAGTNQCQSPNVKYQKFIDPNERNLVAEVSCKELIIYEPIISNIQYPISQYPNILLYDCGVKLSIIRSLIKRGCRIIRIPWNYEIGNWEMFAFGKEMGKLGNYNINGIVISNGPGDPTKCDKTIEQIQKIITMKQCNNGTIPILGICLGNQILALAARAKTYKLKYGHRGQNQPVIENLKLQFKIKNFQNQKLISQYPNISISNYQKAFITSQNHGYAVDEKTLPKEWEVWFKNLNDNTVEGIKHKEQPWMSVQFHPEAAPGPTDTEWVFDEWLGLVQSAK